MELSVLARTIACPIVASLASLALAADVGQPSAVTAHVIHTATPPTIDGLLREPLWKKAASYGDFALFKGKGKRVADTTFRLACDDAWLYLGVDCRNPDMAALQPIVKGHDWGACRDESVELFLDPGTDGRVYLHYMLSFANARDERIVTGGNIKEYWDMPWRSATHAREDGWSAEIAIPLHASASIAKLPKMRINVARNRRVPFIDAQHVVVEEKVENSSWSPVVKGFHEPRRFRPVAGFAEDVKVRIPPLVKIHNARVQPYYVKEGRLLRRRGRGQGVQQPARRGAGGGGGHAGVRRGAGDWGDGRDGRQGHPPVARRRSCGRCLQSRGGRIAEGPGPE